MCVLLHLCFKSLKDLSVLACVVKVHQNMYGCILIFCHEMLSHFLVISNVHCFLSFLNFPLDATHVSISLRYVVLSQRKINGRNLNVGNRFSVKRQDVVNSEWEKLLLLRVWNCVSGKIIPIALLGGMLSSY